MSSRIALALTCAALAACSSSSGTDAGFPDAVQRVDASPDPDAATDPDAAPDLDAAPDPDAEPDLDAEPDPDAEETDLGTSRLEGFIISEYRPFTGFFSDVTVSSADFSALTAVDGRFAVDHPPVGNDVALTIRHAPLAEGDLAFSTSELTVSIGEGTTSFAFPHLATGCAVYFDVSATASVAPDLFSARCRVGTTPFYIPTGELRRADGTTAFAGEARMDLIPLLHEGADYNAFSVLPGDGKSADGTPLEYLAATEVRFYDASTGDALRVVTTSDGAELEMAAPRLADPMDGFTVWIFRNGHFTDTGATPVALPTPEPRYAVPMFEGGWIAIARASQLDTCVRGTLSWQGAPTGAHLLIHGEDHGSTQYLSADSSGFCFPARKSSIYNLQARITTERFTARVRAQTMTSSTTANCGAMRDQCTDLGELVLADPLPDCVVGHAISYTDSNGNVSMTSSPVTESFDVYVEMPYANKFLLGAWGKAVPTANGDFCATFPAFGVPLHMRAGARGCGASAPHDEQRGTIAFDELDRPDAGAPPAKCGEDETGCLRARNDVVFACPD